MKGMMSSKEEFIEKFRRRTKAFSLDAVKIFQKLPQTEEARIIGKQFLRSAFSVGANYRAVCRARSKAEFFAKLSVTLEEADEVVFWTEILMESNIVIPDHMKKFGQEANEIVAVLATARKNT
jgi:four helix bundle protein